MGYRSDVAYTIRFKTEEAYRLFILEAKANGLGSCFSDDGAMWDEATCDDKNLQINFEAQGVKWYETYPDVIKHNRLLEQAESWAESDAHRQIKDGVEGADEVQHRIGFAFVRIGEDNDDTEERHGGDSDYDWLHVSRQIITDWS